MSLCPLYKLDILKLLPLPHFTWEGLGKSIRYLRKFLQVDFCKLNIPPPFYLCTHHISENNLDTSYWQYFLCAFISLLFTSPFCPSYQAKHFKWEFLTLLQGLTFMKILVKLCFSGESHCSLRSSKEFHALFSPLPS